MNLKKYPMNSETYKMVEDLRKSEIKMSQNCRIPQWKFIDNLIRGRTSNAKRVKK